MKMKIFSILFCCFLLSCQEQQTENATNAETALRKDESSIKPPFPALNIPFNSFFINTDKDTTLYLESGTYIHVPKGSLVNGKGEKISGEAGLKFREFHDAVDIILSGIPMTYEQHGAVHNFESAAMCELKGVGDVKIAPGANLEIGLVSNKRDVDYGLYVFNEQAGEWADIGRDSIYESQPAPIPPAPPARDTLVISNIFPSTEPPKPFKPKLYDPQDKRLIQMEIKNVQDFPELSKFNKVMFRVSKESEYSPKDAKNNWYLATLDKIPGDSRYKIKFIGTDGNNNAVDKEYIVSPIFSGSDYTAALAEFDAKMEAYRVKKEEWDKENARLIAERKAARAKMEAQRKAAEEEWFRNNTNQSRAQIALNVGKTYESTNAVSRIFNVSSFGIYNCDRIYKNLTDRRNLIVQYRDTANNTLAFRNNYLLDLQSDVVLVQQCSLDCYQENFILPTNIPLQIWGVTGTGKFAVSKTFKADELKAEDGLYAMGFELLESDDALRDRLRESAHTMEVR